MILLFQYIGGLPSLPSMSPRIRAAFLAGGAVIGWAAWPTLVIFAQPAPPFLILGLAAALDFVLTFVLAASFGRLRRTFSISIKTIAVVTLGVTLNNMFYLMAIARIGPAEANVLHYLWPIFLTIILSITHWRLPKIGQIVGILIAFCGAILVIGPQFKNELELTGLVFAFSGASTFAIYSAIRSYGTEKQDVIGPSMGAVALVCLTIHFLFEETTALNLQQSLAIGAIGLIPMAISNRLWDHAARSGHTSSIAAIAYLNPLIALALLSITLATPLTLTVKLAAILIVLGAMIASRK